MVHSFKYHQRREGASLHARRLPSSPCFLVVKSSFILGSLGVLAANQFSFSLVQNFGLVGPVGWVFSRGAEPMARGRRPFPRLQPSVVEVVDLVNLKSPVTNSRPAQSWTRRSRSCCLRSLQIALPTAR